VLQGWVVVVTSFAYLGLLFAIAYYADRRADAGRSLIANPYIYALSLAVYATAWTFYGSVGRAAADGVGFLPIYIGPTLMIALWWVVMRKILRISKENRITSLADFIASRYGKSALVGGVVTVIAVIGIVPYISLQLKAVSNSFTIVLQYPEIVMPTTVGAVPVLQDTALWVALILAAFTILFGTRHLYSAEHHEGMVAAIAFESLVKLLAFLAVGAFVTFGIYDGFGDVFARAAEVKSLRPLLTPLEGVAGGYANWVWLTVLSMLAIMFLPRQFQVSVIENTDEKHLNKAIWLFPLYMLAINVFVLPIAFGGRLHFPGGGVDADTFVLTIPMAEREELLALLVFIGGLSAATGMVIVETIALSTMVCNDLVMPVLLRLRRLRLAERRDLTGLLLGIRRGAILLILLLGYLYFRLAGEAYALVSIGLISFAAVAQFAPAALGGIFWKGGTRRGALAGLLAGFGVWFYTLLLPALARSGWLPIGLLEQGPFGIALLKPLQLFGLSGLDQITHAMLWSMIANVGAYVWVSLSGAQSAEEHRQGSVFVDVFRRSPQTAGARFWRGTASASDLHSLLPRLRRAQGAALARAGARGGRGPGAPRRDAARRRDRRLVGPHHGRLGGQGGGVDAGGGAQDPRRGVAGGAVQPPPRAEVARARGGERRAARRQREAQGRLPFHRHARVAHAAHLDPGVHRDPQPGPARRSRATPQVPRHHHQGDRALDPPHQSGAGPRQDRVGEGGLARDRGRPARGGGRHAQRDEPVLPGEQRARGGAPSGAGVAGEGGPRPPRAGDAQPPFQRGEVLQSAGPGGRDRADAARAHAASRCL
jgi:Na+/proline symporter